MAWNPINPSLISGTQNNAAIASGTSVTVSSTGSVTAGNLMVVVMVVGGATAPSGLTPPAGWTTSLATIATASGGTIVAAIFTKLITATGAFSGSFSWTTTATSGHWAFMEWTGQGASLLDGSVSDTQNATSTTPTSPSVTPGAGLTNDTLVCCLFAGALVADTPTIPTGMSAITSMATAGTASVPFFFGASLALSSASATGTKSWAIGTTDTTLGVSFLIQQGRLVVNDAIDLPPTRSAGDLGQFDLRSWTTRDAYALFYPPPNTPRAPVFSNPNRGYEPNWYRSWEWKYNSELIGRDQRNPGQQLYDLTPLSVEPNPRRSWEAKYNQNLIGKDVLPIRQQDWPVPQPVIWYRNWAIWLGETELAVPFNQLDWPNPKAPPRDLFPWSWSYNLNLIGQDKFPAGQIVSGLPPQPTPRQVDLSNWINNVNLALNTTPIVLPSNQYSWPNPAPVTWYQSWTQSPAVPPSTAAPFAQTDWPLPTQPYRPDFTYVNFLIGPETSPLNQQTDFPLPVQPQPLLQTWISNVNLALTSAVVAPLPFNQSDWPFPRAPLNSAPSWTWSYNQNLIGQDRLPIRQSDWPLSAPPADGRSWIVATNLALNFVPAGLPFNQFDWPLPGSVLIKFNGDQPPQLLGTTLFVQPAILFAQALL